jgi:RNA polymerase sigma-70 factor (ECF subfamily)
MARSASTAASAADPAVAAAVAAAYESDWGRIIATLIRITGDWSLAEDSAQDAIELALQRWGRDGVPRNPGAWLTTAAKNRALDRLRRAASEASKLREIGIMNELESWAGGYERDDEIVDDRLRLIFTCCHPALLPEARVAMTLRTVAGLSTAQIARAFLLPEQAMSQRLVRAKRKIKNAGIPYRVPPGHLLGERLGGVLAVLYLLFNEGYSASSRVLVGEAIHVTRALVQLMPDEPEAAGLLALMLLQDSRREARMGSDGVPLTLEEQDRGLWDRGAIVEGLAILEAALRRRAAGSYQVQAAIAACHAQAASADQTDWAQIVELYDQLLARHPSPVIELNRAIAVGMLTGPAAGLELVSRLEPLLAGYYLLAAAQGDLLRRLGRTDDAILRYRDAIASAPSELERRFFARRIAEMACLK